MSGVIDPNDLPNAGTPPFFPSLLASIRGVAPSLPLDPVVLQALLLCILAGDKSLILRTREDDIGSVSKLVASVSKSRIFLLLSSPLTISGLPKYIISPIRETRLNRSVRQAYAALGVPRIRTGLNLYIE